MSIDTICYCGHDCGRCVTYIATQKKTMTYCANNPENFIMSKWEFRFPWKNAPAPVAGRSAPSIRTVRFENAAMKKAFVLAVCVQYIPALC